MERYRKDGKRQERKKWYGLVIVYTGMNNYVLSQNDEFLVLLLASVSFRVLCGIFIGHEPELMSHTIRVWRIVRTSVGPVHIVKC